jgi:polar amino acid transport system permease protein
VGRSSVTGWEGFAFTFLNPRIAAQYWPKILEGLGVTIVLAALIIVAGLALGLGLAVLRSLGIRALNWAIIFVVDLFRALPPIVLIVLIYFGLPAAGIGFSGFWATWLALTLVLMAFAEEIFWGSICAVPKGQWEAGRALGLNFLPTLGKIVLPQAMRIAVPPLTNRTIAITKGTALGSVVAVAEILGAAQSAMAFSGNPTPLMMGAIAYLILFLPVVTLGRWIETRFAWRR